MKSVTECIPTDGSTLSNTPVRINGGIYFEIQTIFAHNPSETAAQGAYVKLYESTSAPTGSTVPIFRWWVSPGAVAGSGGNMVTIPVFAQHANLWIAVATEAAAGLSAPSAAFRVSITRSVAGGAGPGAGG